MSIDFSGWSSAEMTALLTAVKAEITRRVVGGAITSGSTANQSWSVQRMSDSDLAGLNNGLLEALGLSNQTVLASPNFNRSQSLADREFSE